MENKNIPILAILVFAIYMLFSKKKKFDIENIVDDLEKHPTKTFPLRNLNQIDRLILHHFAGNGTPYAVAHYHVKPEEWINGENVGGRNWPGIGYHYVIAKNGTVYQTNNWNTVSYHVSGQNTNSIGIALEGNFKIEQHEPAQIDSLNKLIPYLRSQFIQPLEVYQHSDFANKPYDANLDLTPYKL